MRSTTVSGSASCEPAAAATSGRSRGVGTDAGRTGALADAFGSLRQQQARGQSQHDRCAEQRADPLRDQLSSHPPLALRQTEFAQEAEAWWRRHPGARRYRGRRNLREHRARSRLDLPQEWRR